MDERDYELGFQLRLENIAATEKFDEVLEIAIETCLRDRNMYDAALKNVEATSPETVSLDQATVTKLGLWGLRANSDFSRLSHTFYKSAADDLPPPLMVDILEEPTIVPLSPDRKVQDRIEAFGTAIIKEAFRCLGHEASEKARDFASANAKEQYEILLWLYARIAHIRDYKSADSTGEDSTSEQNFQDAEIRLVPADQIPEETISAEPIIIDFRESTLDEVREAVDVMLGDDLPDVEDSHVDHTDEYFYHPVRLSPKFIGTYPEININPTCLGVSILAASFFEAAGATYMHAGVMLTDVEATRISQLHSINKTLIYAEDNHITLNNAADKTLDSIEETICKMRRSDRGHHALSMVRLADDTWVQFDPNYNSLHKFMSMDAEKADKVYEELKSYQNLDTGAVQMLESAEGMYADVYRFAMSRLDEKTPESVADAVDAIMQAEDPVEELKTYLIGLMAELPYINDIVDLQTAVSIGDKEKYIDIMLDTVINKYVLAGMEPDATQKRYSQDPAFRARRIEDMAMAPYLLLLKFLSEYSSLETARYIHAPSALLELGLPAFRIGACVLSDFAIYTNNEVPLSFWAANWTSHVAVEDHMPAKNDESPQAELARRMSSILRSGELRHFTSYGIVHRFLEQGENKTDGD